MQFLLKPNWQQLNRYIWNSLEKSAPADVYIELYRFQGRILGIDSRANEPDVTQEEIDARNMFLIIINDTKLAKNEFKKYNPPTNEAICIELLEGFYGVLKDNFGTKLAKKYYSKLSQFLLEHNLRYKLDANCKFHLTIQGILMTQYVHLRQFLENNPECSECLSELEDIISNLHQSQQQRNCVRVSSNLLENLVVAKANRRASTLSRALEQCPVDLFPHDAVRESLKKIYDFACDYPNIRHAGRPESRLRDLRNDDVLLILSLTIGFASFLSRENVSQTILSGDI